MKSGRGLSLVLTAGWLTGCLNIGPSSGDHLGSPIKDSADPGFLAFSRGDHPISPWFGYRIEGRQSSGRRRLVFFHEREDGEQEVLGALQVDGWGTSINEREAAYAISEDGRTLLYLHTVPENAPGKSYGLYRHVHGSGDELIQPGARGVWEGCPPLYSFPRNTIMFMIEALLEQDALQAVRFRSTEGDEAPLILWEGNALHRAVLEGDVSGAEDAAGLGEDLEARTSFGLTPLHLAVMTEQTEMIRSLIESGADVDATLVRKGKDSGSIALQLAVLFNREDRALELLLEGGADVNSIDFAGFTPLRWAIEIVQLGPLPFEFLVRIGFGGVSAFVAYPEKQWAMKESFDGTSRIEKLLIAGANPEIKDAEGDTPLHRAAAIGELEAVRLLLEFGADPNACGHDGVRPLDCAKTGEIADLLVAYGASPDLRKSERKRSEGN